MKAKSSRGESAPRKWTPSRSTVTAVRVLGAAGLLSAALSSAAGFFGAPFLLGVAGLVMIAANVYAITADEDGRPLAQEEQALQETQGPDGQHANGGVQ